MSFVLTEDQLQQLQPPVGSVFSLGGTREFVTPHPYCIGTKHVEYASNHCGGILDLAAIEGAEKAGAYCEICRERKRIDYSWEILSCKQHEAHKALVVIVPEDSQDNLNAVEGLHAWLLSIKERAESFGVTTFAFPTPSQHHS